MAEMSINGSRLAFRAVAAITITNLALALGSPAYFGRKHRKQVGRHYAYEESKYDQEQLQLLKAFDPDILINCSNVQIPPFLAPFRERTFSLDVMRWNPWGTQEMMAFLEVWPFLQENTTLALYGAATRRSAGPIAENQVQALP